MAAIKPLFFGSTKELSNLLRLQNLAGGGTGEDLMQFAITEGATTFWQNLGSAILQDLIALPEVIPPVSDDDFRRLIAKQLEVDVVKYHLSGHMPMAYKDGRAEFAQTWNTESGFKLVTPDQTRRIRYDWWYDRHRGIKIRFKLLKGENLTRVILSGVEDADTILLNPISYYGNEAALLIGGVPF